MELQTHLADAAGAEAVLSRHVLRPLPGHQVQGDAAVAVGIRGQPDGEIQPEGLT